MALTKASDIALGGITTVAQHAKSVATEIDCSGMYEWDLAISMALINTTAHTGTRVIVRGNTYATGNEHWKTLAEFIMCVGTANTEIALAEWAAEATTLSVTDGTGFVTDGFLYCYVKDPTDILNGEFVWQIAVDSPSADRIWLQHALARTHVITTSLISNVAQTVVVGIPPSMSRVDVVVDNTYDIDGAAVDYLLTLAKITGV